MNFLTFLVIFCCAAAVFAAVLASGDKGQRAGLVRCEECGDLTVSNNMAKYTCLICGKRFCAYCMGGSVTKCVDCEDLEKG